jgi:hypothetical protein
MRLLCVAATVATMLVGAAPASAAWEETKTVYPLTKTYYNTCNDELVLLNADYTEIVRSNFESGRFRFQTAGWLSNVRANDTASGRPYDVQDAFAYALDNREDKGYYRTTQVQVIRLKPRGATGNKQTLLVTAFRRYTFSLTTGEMVGNPVETDRTACV